MVLRKINRGRHTDHPAGCHSIRTNQCPSPPSPHFLQAGCPSCRPTNSVKALKANAITVVINHYSILSKISSVFQPVFAITCISQICQHLTLITICPKKRSATCYTEVINSFNDITHIVFSGTLNPTHFTSPKILVQKISYIIYSLN